MAIQEEPVLTGQTAPLSETKRRLLARLRSDRAQAHLPPAGLVSLRAGHADPVVLIHPVDGSLLCYTGLVRDLPAGRPVLGVAAEPGRAGATTVEELASRGLSLLAAGGVTPAVLAGWSVGGVIAYEMARQAGPAGQPVGALVLIDAMPAPPAYAGSERPVPMVLAEFAEYLARSTGVPPVVVDPARWPAGPPAGLPAALDHLAGLFAAAGTPLDQTPDQLLTDFQGFARISGAVDRYRPRPSRVRAALVRGSRSPVRPECWDHAVIESDHVVPGDHYTLLQSPAVATVAALVAAA